MLVKFDGKEYPFDIEALDLSEARYIKKVTGLSIRKLLDGLVEVDPESLAALYWLMLKQNGQVVDMNKVNFSVMKFGIALGQAIDADSEDGAEADPTEAAPEPAPVTA